MSDKGCREAQDAKWWAVHALGEARWRGNFFLCVFLGLGALIVYNSAVSARRHAAVSERLGAIEARCQCRP